MRQVVCKRYELEPGQMRTVMKGKVPVIVVCSGPDAYYAVRGVCPHQGASLVHGEITSLTVSEEPGVYGVSGHAEILRCPWHSFDYDVATGACVSDPGLRVKTYPVYVEDEEIVVDL